MGRPVIFSSVNGLDTIEGFDLFTSWQTIGELKTLSTTSTQWHKVKKNSYVIGAVLHLMWVWRLVFREGVVFQPHYNTATSRIAFYSCQIYFVNSVKRLLSLIVNFNFSILRSSINAHLSASLYSFVFSVLMFSLILVQLAVYVRSTVCVLEAAVKQWRERAGTEARASGVGEERRGEWNWGCLWSPPPDLRHGAGGSKQLVLCGSHGTLKFLSHLQHSLHQVH